MNRHGEPTTREELRQARENAWRRVADKWEELTGSYPLGHAANRDAFIRREAEAAAKELEKRQLDVTPKPDGGRR